MRRAFPTLLAACGLALVPASTASARILELGPTGGKKLAKASCPDNPCLAVTRTTGFQVTEGDRRNMFVIPENGRVVAITLSLGKPSTTQIDFFNRQAGGTARARVAILRSAGTSGGAPRYALNAQSGDIDLQPFFGSTVQFPLYTSLLVRKGYIVALSVPTWAPVLAVSNLSEGYSWRSSRVAPCSTTPERQPPHVEPGTTRSYFCLYRPAQLTYSVTMVTSPTAGGTTESGNNNRSGNSNN